MTAELLQVLLEDRELILEGSLEAIRRQLRGIQVPSQAALLERYRDYAEILAAHWERGDETEARVWAEKSVQAALDQNIPPGEAVRILDIFGVAVRSRLEARLGAGPALVAALAAWHTGTNYLQHQFLDAYDRIQDGRLARLHQLAQAITAELSLDPLLDRIVAAAKELTSARYGFLLLYEEDRLVKLISPGIEEADVTAIKELPIGQSFLDSFFNERRPVRVADMTQDPRFLVSGWRGTEMRSFLGLPILIRGTVYGILSLMDKEGSQPFSAGDERMVEILAGYATAAIENARLYEETRQGKSLAVLNEIARAAAGTLDVATAFPTIGNAVRRAMETDRISAALLEPGSETVKVFAAHTFGMPTAILPGMNYPLSAVLREVLAKGGGVVWDDLAAGEAQGNELLIRDGLRSMITVPLISHDRIIGFFTIGSRREGTYQVAQLPLVQAIADQIAPGIENTRLYQETQQNSAFRAVLNEISRAIASSLDIETIFPSVGQAVRRVIEADRTAVTLLDADEAKATVVAAHAFGGEMVAGAGTSYPLSPGLVQALMTGTGGTWNEPMDYSAAGNQPLAQGGLRSTVAAPLKSRDRVIGFFSVSSRRPQAYGEEHVPLVRAIADQMAPVIENALLYQELRRSAVSRSLLGRILQDLQTTGGLSEGSMFRAGLELPRRHPSRSLTESLESFTSMGLGTLTLVERDEARVRWTFRGDNLVEVKADSFQPT